MRIVFMGTPEFAIPSLAFLIQEHEVVGLFTQPDRPKGRGKHLSPPPVKEYALKYPEIPIYQPEKIKTEEYEIILKNLKPDMIIVIAYGQILNKEILDIPKLACINVHASLLPELRGASPINTAIVRGYKETGVTTMKMDIGLDSGDILLKKSIHIEDEMNAGELHDQLMLLGMEVLKETLETYGNIKPIPQNHPLATYAPIIKKEMAMINWTMTAETIYNSVKGYNPWPVAYTTADGKRIKVYRCKIIKDKTNELPGTIVKFDKNGFWVQTGDEIINIMELQLPGGKRMSIEQFALGYHFEIGLKLGE
ncbi:MAG: methionyl-tRNA formyltransferase [Clostridiales bacterium]|nr:methionyl-tRNA formyltransferase [Clostridiales bacterium]